VTGQAGSRSDRCTSVFMSTDVHPYLCRCGYRLGAWYMVCICIVWVCIECVCMVCICIVWVSPWSLVHRMYMHRMGMHRMGIALEPSTSVWVYRYGYMGMPIDLPHRLALSTCPIDLPYRLAPSPCPIDLACHLCLSTWSLTPDKFKEDLTKLQVHNHV